MIYLSGHVGRHRHPRLGFMITLDTKYKAPAGAIIAADNACFSNPSAYSDERYEKFLRGLPRERTLFATAPDVLGNHQATVERSVPMLSRIRELGFRAAFVAQDGWDNDTTPWDELDTLFIGGSTDFKFRGGRDAVFAAKRRGKMVHMGRVNSLDRLRAAAGIGCDSADGNKLAFGPDSNWPQVKYWLDHMDMQPEMPF